MHTVERADSDYGIAKDWQLFEVMVNLHIAAKVEILAFSAFEGQDFGEMIAAPRLARLILRSGIFVLFLPATVADFEIKIFQKCRLTGKQ
jgi:hypothetical protein